MCKKVVKTSTTMTRANIFIARVVETGGVAPSFLFHFRMFRDWSMASLFVSVNFGATTLLNATFL